MGNLPSILDFVTEHNLEHSWAFLNDPEVYDPTHKNRYTLSAKEKLSNSSYKVCKDISKVIAVGKDNDEQLDLFIKKQDWLRKIDIKDYLNFRLK